MIIGNKLKSGISHNDVFDFIWIGGQSNAEGAAQVTRLSNNQFNYWGINSGYPSTRTNQSKYTKTPANVHIYNKANSNQNSNFVTDNAAWEAYDADTTARFDSPITKQFGCELSMGTRIAARTGRDVGFVKSGFGGTALIHGTTTNAPGTWNYSNRNIAIEFLIKRAIRDLKTYQSGKMVNPLCKVWWQGETDGINGQSKAAYKASLSELVVYMDKGFKDNFSLNHVVPWFFVLPSYNRNAAEQLIRDAITEFCGENPNCYYFDIDAYPRKTSLTTAEAAPLAKGTPNADGGNDDNHQSYIAQLAVGEILSDKLIELGLI